MTHEGVRWNGLLWKVLDGECQCNMDDSGHDDTGVSAVWIHMRRL